MSASSDTTVTVVRPGPAEIAVAYLPDGGTVRVRRADGTVRDVASLLPGEPLAVASPGDAARLGWGGTDVTGFGLSVIRNLHHRLDRPVWHKAARAVRHGGVVYVRLEQRDYYGKPRWTAVGLRTERGTA
jgi:hypothetical protein